jgi:hypothetical protein
MRGGYGGGRYLPPPRGSHRHLSTVSSGHPLHTRAPAPAVTTAIPARCALGAPRAERVAVQREVARHLVLLRLRPGLQGGGGQWWRALRAAGASLLVSLRQPVLGPDRFSGQGPTCQSGAPTHGLCAAWSSRCAHPLFAAPPGRCRGALSGPTTVVTAATPAPAPLRVHWRQVPTQ